MYKGELNGFPEEVVEKMLERQFEQDNVKDITVFEDNIYGGFSWSNSIEGLTFWLNVISQRNFDLFFDKYPKIEEEEDEDEMLFDLAHEHLTNKQIKRLYFKRFGKICIKVN